MTPLKQAFIEYRKQCFESARVMTGDDKVALLMLDLVAQAKYMLRNKRILWCAGIRLGADPQYAGEEGLRAIADEYYEGMNQVEDSSEAGRYRKTHRVPWEEFQV